ncbi:MAG: NAD(P)-dependent oxidoreductase [Candidatus Saccharimonadia bacterium]
MEKLCFYDVSPVDQTQLQQHLNNLPATFSSEHLSVENADPEATVLSVFVSSKVTAEMITKMPKLKLIACRSTGVDNIDIAAAKSRHIAIASVPTYGEHTVAEYTFALLLTLSRKIIAAELALRDGQTDHSNLQGFDLFGRTFGLLGAGKIGRNVAILARAFGMNVIAYDPFPNNDAAAQIGYTYSTLDEVLKSSDVISMHVPYLPENDHLMNEQRFALMKPTAILLNTSRGEVVDTKALISALKDHRLGGAALDVFEGEKLVGIDEEMFQLRAQQVDTMALEADIELSILQKLPNVLMTNHNAYNTVEAVGRINQTSVENITKFLASEPQNLIP